MSVVCSLTVVSVRGNPIMFPPAEILFLGWAVTRAFLQDFCPPQSAAAPVDPAVTAAEADPDQAAR